jgi:hypothetical protein
LDKPKIGKPFQIRQIFEISGIGEGIQNDHAIAWVLLAPVMDKIRADKSGTACNQYSARFSR